MDPVQSEATTTIVEETKTETEVEIQAKYGFAIEETE